MIVYSNRKRKVCPYTALRSLCNAPAASEDDILSLLIEFGEIEAGIEDHIWAEADGESELDRRLARASICLGHLFLGGCVIPWRDAIGAVVDMPLPREVEVSTPEGYAWYGLHPRCYAVAADLFCERERPARLVVLGIRSIGTSLSGVVAAALDARGVAVERCTIRPRGHPFDRRLKLALALRAQWESAAASQAHFAIVDEGPGLSGSSFMAVAREISSMRVPDERIAIFPSSTPDSNGFVSEDARLRWPRHRKYVGPPLQPPEPVQRDLSAGNWRAFFYSDSKQYPAVHPQHERMKYLTADSGGLSVTKFCGFGRYGRAKLERGRILAQEGFTPATESAASGFLSQTLVAGRPLQTRVVTPELLATIARYLKTLIRRFPAAQTTPDHDLVEMALVNVREGLGDEWAGRLESLLRQTPLRVECSVAVDARLLPHEWVFDGRAYMKTDALDHHDDHFSPGCCDIAWDVVGAMAEFDLDAGQREFLINQLGFHSAERLTTFELLYLAFRLGYSVHCAESLSGSPDGMRFAQLAARYRGALKRVLLQGCA